MQLKCSQRRINVGFAPIRWLHSFVRWYVGSVKSHFKAPTISFDAERIRIVEASGEDVGFPWEAVRRIGYRTIDALGPDHFLEFQLSDGQAVWIQPDWPGAQALCKHVQHLPDTRIDPERGFLANVIGNDSIILWPSREAGGSLDD